MNQAYIKLFSIFFCTIGISFSACASVKKTPEAMVINKAITIKAQKNLVWKALTNENDLSQWWNEGVKLEPHVGGEFYEPWGDGQLATGEVLKVKNQEYIEFTWHEKYWELSQKTVCRFSVEEKSGMTILKVIHIGWESFPSESQEGLVEGFKGGWDSLLPKIKGYLEEK